MLSRPSLLVVAEDLPVRSQIGSRNVARTLGLPLCLVHGRDQGGDMCDYRSRCRCADRSAGRSDRPQSGSAHRRGHHSSGADRRRDTGRGGGWWRGGRRKGGRGLQIFDIEAFAGPEQTGAAVISGTSSRHRTTTACRFLNDGLAAT